MAKKRSARVSTKRKAKKKSWWTMFFVLAIATAIGLPVAYNMTVQDSQIASNGKSKIAVALSSVNNLTLTRGSCPINTSGTPGAYASVQFTCNDGYGSAFVPDQCKDVNELVKYAENACASRGQSVPIVTPTPYFFPNTTSTPAPSKAPTPTGTTGGTQCTGAGPNGKILICFISKCADKGLASYTAGDAYCKGLGKTNCCAY